MNNAADPVLAQALAKRLALVLAWFIDWLERALAEAAARAPGTIAPPPARPRTTRAPRRPAAPPITAQSANARRNAPACAPIAQTGAKLRLIPPPQPAIMRGFDVSLAGESGVRHRRRRNRPPETLRHTGPPWENGSLESRPRSGRTDGVRAAFARISQVP